MGCINGIRTEHPSRRDDPNRWLLLFHNVYLNRRSLCPEQDVIGNIERILCISCRMVWRQIQSFKVIIIVFHFRTICNRKAHAEEDFLDFVFHDGQRMQTADFLLLARQCDVQGFRLELLFQSSFCNGSLLLGDRRFNVRANGVCQLSHNRTFFCGEFSHLFQDGGQCSFFSKVLYPNRIQLLCIRTGLQGSFCFLPNGFQLFFHK